MRTSARRIWLLLRKDLRILLRSPGLVGALVVYPLVVAVVIGLVVRYAGDEPRVALVDEDGLPAVIEVGAQRFDVARLFARAARDVELVPLDVDEADRRLTSGDVLGVVVIPSGFERDLRSLTQTPRVVLRTTGTGLANRVVAQVESFVYRLNRELQESYIRSNLDDLELLANGGRGTFAGQEYDVIGLVGAKERLDVLARSPDAEVAERARALRQFIDQIGIALDSTDDALKATANPIELVEEGGGGGTILSARVQAYALALTLALVALVLAAASLAAERDENVLGRLTRGLVGRGELVGEKVAFVALVGATIGLLLAVAFGITVELGEAPGGQPWQRLPLVVVGLLLGAASLAALGALIGTLAREARTATLVAFLAALPIVLLGIVPTGIVPAAGWISDAFPFVHATRFFDAAISDAGPAGRAGREAAWLVGLAVVYGVAARMSVRRLAA